VSAKIVTLPNTKRAGGNIKVLRSVGQNPKVKVEEKFSIADFAETNKQFNAFWDLMDTVEKHGYLRASMSVIGRSTVGTWWTLRKNEQNQTGLASDAKPIQAKRLQEFYSPSNRSWDNISDFHTIAYKLMIGAMYLRYFGQAAYLILRNKDKKAVGLDFLSGLIIPNVDATGKFKDVAFLQYPSPDQKNVIEYKDPRDIVFITTPDWSGSPIGGTDIRSLSEYTLPIDIYLQLAAREYLKNRDTPEVVYELPTDISDEAFDAFVTEMSARRGAGNSGKNPIAVQGEFAVHELKGLPSSLPYQESRKESREELLAVTGVSGAKLGLSSTASNIVALRREFHETTMLPLFKMIELGFYEQIHQREFGISGWEFKFNSPDFLSAVERATVHLRYKQMGVLSPNEIRFDLGKSAREDAGGDMYEEPKNTQNPQGNPPEGRPAEPDAPSNTGEPNTDAEDPERGDNHDDAPREQLFRELANWKTFVSKRLKRTGVQPKRKFKSDVINPRLYSIVDTYLDSATTVEEVAEVFETVYAFIEEARSL